MEAHRRAMTTGPQHISLAVDAVLRRLGMEKDAGRSPRQLREETSGRDAQTAHSALCKVTGATPEFQRGTDAFDGRLVSSLRRPGPEPHASSLVSQTPARACEVPRGRGKIRGGANALATRAGAQPYRRNGACPRRTAITGPGRLSK